MAPPKKPAARRQRTTTVDVGTVVPTTGRTVPPAPHPPGRRRLLEETSTAWATFWADDMSAMVKPAEMPALIRLFRMYDLRARLERLLYGEPMVAGSMGQPKVNPAAGEIASLDKRIVALEDRFGLSPAARLKLGVTFGLAAKSLEDLNRDFDEAGVRQDTDPRRPAIDTTGR